MWKFFIWLSSVALMGRLPWKRLPGYWIAQYLAAFVSSAVVFGVYYGNIITNIFVNQIIIYSIIV